MTYLISIGITLALLAGFVVLTGYETRRGVRVLGAQRSNLDRHVERLVFIFDHVDLSAFLRDEIRRLISRLGHDLAHLSLQVVRSTERLLTRLVRHLRSRNAVDPAPRESTREFVKTLSDFKGRLKATHPEISDIQ